MGGALCLRGERFAPCYSISNRPVRLGSGPPGGATVMPTMECVILFNVRSLVRLRLLDYHNHTHLRNLYRYRIVRILGSKMKRSNRNLHSTLPLLRHFDQPRQLLIFAMQDCGRTQKTAPPLTHISLSLQKWFMISR